jgi:hypothetical protein
MDLTNRVLRLVRPSSKSLGSPDADANARFTDQFDRLQALRDPDTQSEAEAAVLTDLQKLADERGVTLLYPNDRVTVELSKLPLREIERRLGVTQEDLDYGKTAYVHIYPRGRREMPDEANKRERMFSKIMDKLRRGWFQIGQ